MFRRIKVKNLVMACSRCLKDQEKITWFDSGQQQFFDEAFYCKPCWRTFYLMLPKEKRKEWKWK